jgi:thymidylate synthase
MNMKQYLNAVRKILKEGTRKENRTGVDTISRFNVNYEIDLRDGFPLLTTKDINWKNIVVENLWFLSGEPDIAILKKHGCKFWDAWAAEDGTVPSAYGNFWRRFPVHEHSEDFVPTTTVTAFNDQIAWAIDELQRNPMSRRLVVSAWAPGNAQTSKLPPCHIQFVLNVQNLRKRKPHGYMGRWEGVGDTPEPHLCLHLTQRSCDIALGVPYNIAGYAFLLELFARFAGLPVGIFGHTLVDAHAYTSKPDGSKAEYDHIPGLQEQLTRDPRPLPRLKIDESIKGLDDIDRLLSMDTDRVMSHFQLEGYNPHPAIKFKVAV